MNKGFILAILITNIFVFSNGLSAVHAADSCADLEKTLSLKRENLNIETTALASSTAKLKDYLSSYAGRILQRQIKKLESYKSELAAMELKKASNVACPAPARAVTREQRIACQLNRKIVRLNSKISSLSSLISKKDAKHKTLTEEVSLLQKSVENLTTSLEKAQSDFNNCPSGKQEVRFNFDNFTVGTKYPINQGFDLGQIPVLVTPFTYVTGAVSAAPFNAEVVLKGSFFNHPDFIGTSDLGIYPGNVNLQFTLHKCAKKVRFSYIDGGGQVNLKVNSVLQSVSDFSDLAGTTLDKALVSKSEIPFNSPQQFQDSGVLELTSSCITSFEIGGQEAVFDDLLIEY